MYWRPYVKWGALVFLLGVGCSAQIADVLRAYPSPNRLEGIRVREIPSDHLARLRSIEDAGDFDGDGTADEVSVSYFHIEPLFEPTTSGLLEIRSGVDGVVLLARTLPTPFTRVAWYGDADFNGTEDVLVSDDGHVLVYGRVAKR